METPIKYLAMDFDGVISDSILECAVSGKNGYSAYKGLLKRVSAPGDIAASEMDVFRSMRPFIRSGEDYVFLFQAMDEGFEIMSQAHFNQFLDRNIERKEDYYRHFYAKRESLLDDDREAWLALSPLFDGMAEFLGSVNSRLHLEIVSTKDSRFIAEILESNGIKLYPGQIHQAGRGRSKSEIVIDTVNRLDFTHDQALFIDDHLETCGKVSTTGVTTLLAGWGYNNEEQRLAASESNVRTIGLEHFYTEFRR